MGYNPETAGKRLAEFRKERGMSQEKFAAEFNITRQYLSLLERGLRSASLDLLVDIADKYDTSLDYIARGKMSDIKQADKKINRAKDTIELALKELNNINHL